MALARIGGTNRFLRRINTGLNSLNISVHECFWRPIMLAHECRILLDRLSINSTAHSRHKGLLSATKQFAISYVSWIIG